MLEHFREIFHLKEKEILGKEIYKKARELFERDKTKEGIVIYSFNPKDYEVIKEELQQFGPSNFLSESAGIPLLFISINETNDLQVTFKTEIIPDEIPEGVILEYSSKHKDFQLIVNPGGKCYFSTITARENYFGPFTDFDGELAAEKGKLEISIDNIPRNATKNEIRVFQAILSKNLQKVKIEN